MSEGERPIRIVDADAGPLLEDARRLFRDYAENTAGTTAESLCFQSFDAEVRGLPGRYVRPSGCLLLAMDGDTPVGCVAMRDLGDGTCEMKRLFVAPEGRGRGVGTRLVETVVARGELVGYRRMVLDTLPEMADAIALYRRHGFTDAAPYWDNPVPQAIYLERKLGA